MQSENEWFPLFNPNSDPIKFLDDLSNLSWINQLTGKTKGDKKINYNAVVNQAEDLPPLDEISLKGPKPSYLFGYMTDLGKNYSKAIDDFILDTWDYPEAINILSEIILKTDSSKAKMTFNLWNTVVEFGEENFPIVIPLEKIRQTNPGLESDLMARSEVLGQFWDSLKREITSKLDSQKTLANNMLSGKLGVEYTRNDLFIILSFLENNSIFILPKGQQSAIIERICGALGANSNGYRQVKSKNKDMDTEEFAEYIKQLVNKTK